MTTSIFATDPIDSGEILHPNIVDTDVLDTRAVAEGTRTLTGKARNLPPTRGLRRSGLTEEQPLYQPRMIGVVSDPLAVTERLLLPPGQPRPPAPLPPPPKPDPAPLTAKPLFERGRHRRTPIPMWAYLAAVAVLGSVGTVVLELAALAVLR